jgi:hypothetical protein
MCWMVGYKENNTEFETVVENNYCTHNPLKRVLVAGFMRPQGQYKCSKMTRGDKKVHYRPTHQKNFPKFLRFFDFFPRIFFKMKFKNNVCLNLTTRTLKYHLDVSQLSDQCFRSFLLSLLTKKSKHFLFENFLVGP